MICFERESTAVVIGVVIEFLEGGIFGDICEDLIFSNMRISRLFLLRLGRSL